MKSEGLEEKPAAESLIETARAMIPTLQERARGHVADRRIGAETINELRDAGLFRVLQPVRRGGYEMSPSVFAEIQMALAEGDMATAWVYGVIGVHPFQLALFDDRAAEDVWGEDESVLIASSYMPTGRATPVDGGFRFSGRWKFSSGSEHVEWFFLGGMVGDPAEGDYRTFLVPLSDARIEDTWFAMGLKGTGSQDIIVDDVFVPAHRVHNLAGAYAGENPGQSINDGWLYRLPFPLVFGRAVSNSCIGGLQAMLDAFRDYGSKRIGTTGAAIANNPDAQIACAEGMSAIGEMKSTLHRDFSTMESFARRNEQVPMRLKLLFKYQAADASVRCLDLTTKFFRSVGGTGLFETHPFGRLYTDMTAARQHVSNQSQVFGRNLGGTLLGLENTDKQI